MGLYKTWTVDWTGLDWTMDWTMYWTMDSRLFEATWALFSAFFVIFRVLAIMLYVLNASGMERVHRLAKTTLIQ